MAKATVLCAALAMSAAFTLSAENLPLQFKTVPAQEVLNFPGSYGTASMLGSSKPDGLKKEPKAMSRHPLYAECRLFPGNETMLARLDESKGDGKGYDQLLVDLNQNGDLTDEVAVSCVAPAQESTNAGWKLYGPMEAAADQRVAGGRPVLYAQVYFYQPPSSSPSSGRLTLPSGFIRLKAGWYLETTLEVDGVKQKLGLYDANSNLRLGDAPKAQRNSGWDASWSFDRGDVWLVDANGSGSFEDDALQSEAVPFGPLLYVGAKAFKVTLAEDCQSVAVEPWRGALAEVALAPHGEQVRNLTLAWERQGGQWQLIRPTVAGGKFQVPPGNYRLYECSLLGKSASGEQVAVTAIERLTRMPFNFVAGKANKLECGGPLQVAVTASKVRAGNESFYPFGESSSDSKDAVRISARVLGVEGEVYSAYWTGAKLKERPPKPTFTILDATGKEVANGNLEYG